MTTPKPISPLSLSLSRPVFWCLPLSLAMGLGACDADDDAGAPEAEFVAPDSDSDPDSEPWSELELDLDETQDEAAVACVPAPHPINSRRSLFETVANALTSFTMPAIMNAVAVNAGYPATPVQTYNRLVNNYQIGGPALGSRCDDHTALFGGTGLNGYPLECPRAEAFQDFNLASWFPIAAVNRIDKAPADGSNCGEQRIVMATNAGAGGSGRMFMIFEAVIPNPDPSCGVLACRPIAEFWEKMSTDPGLNAPGARNLELQRAFLTGHPVLTAAGFGPFLSADNMTFGSGQVRTNSFDQPPWTLRDHKFGDQSGQLVALTEPVEGNVYGPLWNDLSPWPQGTACRNDIIAGLGALLPNDINLMGLDTGSLCWAGESRQDPTMNYEAQMMAGTGAFMANIGAQLGTLGSPLLPQEIARRATYAGSCMGCHEPGIALPIPDLGAGVIAENSLGFVHVSETVRTTCDTFGDCWQISPALINSFLPHRQNSMMDYLFNTDCLTCAPFVVGEGDQQLAAPGQAGEASAPAPVRVPNVESQADIEALMEYERGLLAARGYSISGAPPSNMH